MDDLVRRATERAGRAGFGRALTTHPALAAVELAHGSGVILATRRGT